MKKRFSQLIGILLICISVSAYAQEPTYQTRLKEANESWQKVRAKHKEEFRALQVFMAEHSRQAQYLPDVERLFMQHLRKASGRLQVDKILKDLKVDGIQSSTAITASESKTEQLKFEEGSTVSYLPDGRENLLGDGAIHRWRGKVNVTLPTKAGTSQEYVFVGDENDPLTFGLIYGVGYVHLHGCGTVIVPGGRILSFEKKEKGQSPIPKLTETQKSDVANIPKLLNDYLIYLIYVINAPPWQETGLPEVRQILKRTAQPIAERHKLPLSPTWEKRYIEFSRETCVGAMDEEKHITVPVFFDKWVDFSRLVAIKERGDFPEILFKGFQVTLAKDGEKYRVNFPDGAWAKVGGKSYTYRGTSDKWVEKKE